ncbi:glycoside hydrolase superfamily [Mycena haematopus]|nr:glycoside hydrolase superfamily [Mycena haematopus]
MLPSSIAFLFALVAVSPAFAASAADWAPRSIYQVLTDRFATSDDSAMPCDTSERTYCGGTWTGIANHLDYIQDMGFDAVWISPVPKNLDGTAYGDGYHGRVLVGRHRHAESALGTADDLKNLSDALHKRGMYLMLDVVNKTPSAFDLIDIDYPTLLPFGSQSDFHHQCFITDYANQTDVEQCWLGDADLPLPDVDTEDEAVVDTLYQWIHNMVTKFAIDGVRIDTVKHIRHDFWAGYAASAGVFTLGEVETDDPAYAASYLDVLDAVLDYPVYYTLTAAFASPYGNLSALENTPMLQSVAPASSSRPLLTAAFLENHDQPRFPSYTPDIALRKNAMVWPFVGDGMPTLYYGQEQGYEGGADPANREACLWLAAYPTTKPGVATVKALNNVRKQAIAANPSFLSTQARWISQPNPSTLMLSKPPLLSLFTNIGTNESVPGTTLVDVLECRTVVVAGGGSSGASAAGGGGQGDGVTRVAAQGGMPLVLIPASMLGQGGACPALASSRSAAAAAGKKERSVGVVRALGMLGTMVVALL